MDAQTIKTVREEVEAARCAAVGIICQSKTSRAARDSAVKHIHKALALLPAESAQEQVEGWTGKPCPHCAGTGETDDALNCSKCGGTGDEYGPILTPAGRMTERRGDKA